jgi:hypothetical protein
MLEIIELLTHYFVTLIKLLKPGGVKVMVAESEPAWPLTLMPGARV